MRRGKWIWRKAAGVRRRKLRGEAVDGSQNPRIWQGNDGEHRASYEVTARTVKFLGKREGNGGAPVGEPPPGWENDDLLPF